MITDPVLIDELLRDVPPEGRDGFIADYLDLAQLPAADCDLETFLGHFLEKLGRLFAACAGAIWFRSADGSRLSLRSELGSDRLGSGPAPAATEEALVRYALAQQRSFVVAPHARPHPRAQVANPCDSFLIFGPVVSHGDRIAVVLLVLGPTPARGIMADVQGRYVVWLDALLEFLVQGIEQRFLGNLAPLQPALTNLESTRAEIEAFKDAIRVSLEVTLNSYAGWNFGSLRNNQTFTRNVHELLDANGLRVACAECGAPSILRCQAAGNAKTGVFLYDHYLESGRTFHGGPTTFPRVRLVAKPPRRRAQ